MAQDAVTIQTIDGDGVNMGAGVTIVVANGARIDGAGAVGGYSPLFIRVTQTDGTERVMTIKAGTAPGADGGAAHRAGLGDRAITVPASTGDMLIAIDPARHMQDDGTIDITFAASFAGKIWAFTTARNPA